MRRPLIYLILFCAASVAASEVPPLCAPVGEMVEGIACARARLGHEDSAMEALEEALDLGFDRFFDLLATDPDLDPLRDRDDFRAAVS